MTTSKSKKAEVIQDMSPIFDEDESTLPVPASPTPISLKLSQNLLFKSDTYVRAVAESRILGLVLRFVSSAAVLHNAITVGTLEPRRCYPRHLL
jgi:hypothetical protein